jgi:hypothetical protein
MWRYQRIRQGLTRPTVPLGLGTDVAIVEVVRRKRQKTQRYAFSDLRRRIANYMFDPSRA